jgi:uncharacterized cupin superfamily protein
MDSINIFRAEDPEGRVDVGGALGSSDTLMFIFDVGPGQRQSPYHYEYEEEWLLVVEGTLVLRAPDGEHTVERGDLVRFPAGPAGAHELINHGESPARTLMFSSARSPAVSVYPDSDTISVWPENDADQLTFRRESAIPWSEVWERSDRER